MLFKIIHNLIRSTIRSEIVNKEAEKVRFSYKMTYGQAPSQEVMNRLMGKGKTVDSKKVSIPPTKSTDELNQERLTEREYINLLVNDLLLPINFSTLTH